MSSKDGERIDNLKYGEKDDDKLPSDECPFIDNPAEFLVARVASELRKVPEFKEIFGCEIHAWRKQDFSIRGLPGLRIYNEQYTKQYDSWFIEGDLLMDLILPASIRHEETQQIQDTLTAALLQQFRRPSFFDTIEKTVPGLNELGKMVTANKALGFEWGETIVPLSQMTINFKIDLREWDGYLEITNRTKDDPFKRTLGDLKKLVNTIQALRDDAEKELEIKSEQEPGEETETIPL